MRFGTSVRFLFPTSAQTHRTFVQLLRAQPPGTFIERPLGDYDTATQASNLLEVASAARDAGLDGFLVGDNHSVPANYANCFQPVPTLARLMANTGRMQVGMVLLAPFYHPVLLAEQIGTLAAFADQPLIVTLANGGRAAAFTGLGMNFRTRAARLEELLLVARRLLAGERVTHHGRFFTLEDVQISPLPRHPVQFWIAGTVNASAARAGELGDGWLTAQNSTSAHLAEQLTMYNAACAGGGRQPLAVLRRDIFVGASDSAARAAVEPILKEGYRGSGTAELLVGSPATVVAQLREYRAMGFEYVMVRHIVGDHALMLDSFARIGRDVLPAIRSR